MSIRQLTMIYRFLKMIAPEPICYVVPVTDPDRITEYLLYGQSFGL